MAIEKTVDIWHHGGKALRIARIEYLKDRDRIMPCEGVKRYIREYCQRARKSLIPKFKDLVHSKQLWKNITQSINQADNCCKGVHIN